MQIRTVGFAEKMFGFKKKQIDFEGTKKLKDVLDFSDIPLNLIAILINGRSANIDSEVKPQDKVVITQIVAGG
ncbi:MAG: MoaD/ThiS family protein [Asgard group archaeon]|nr:MoaD/ThiS family protein [Asgard group archaeon]